MKYENNHSPSNHERVRSEYSSGNRIWPDAFLDPHQALHNIKELLGEIGEAVRGK